MGPHALHSPFLYDLYRKVLKPACSFRIKEIEDQRKQLQQSTELVESTDFKSGKSRLVTFGTIASRSLSKPRFSALLHFLTKYLSSQSALETGTSLGINACYLAASCQKVATIEGAASLALLAERTFESLDYKNISLIRADLYQVLEQTIVRYRPDFYFLDADHRSSAIAFCIDLILKHTPEATCIVLHDIYWSKDMAEMWQSLTEDPRFVLSIDLFQAGLLFPNLAMEKQHFRIRF